MAYPDIVARFMRTLPVAMPREEAEAFLEWINQRKPVDQPVTEEDIAQFRREMAAQRRVAGMRQWMAGQGGDERREFEAYWRQRGIIPKAGQPPGALLNAPVAPAAQAGMRGALFGPAFTPPKSQFPERMLGINARAEALKEWARQLRESRLPEGYVAERWGTKWRKGEGPVVAATVGGKEAEIQLPAEPQSAVRLERVQEVFETINRALRGEEPGEITADEWQMVENSLRGTPQWAAVRRLRDAALEQGRNEMERALAQGDIQGAVEAAENASPLVRDQLRREFVERLPKSAYTAMVQAQAQKLAREQRQQYLKEQAREANMPLFRSWLLQRGLGDMADELEQDVREGRGVGTELWREFKADTTQPLFVVAGDTIKQRSVSKSKTTQPVKERRPVVVPAELPARVEPGNEAVVEQVKEAGLHPEIVAAIEKVQGIDEALEQLAGRYPDDDVGGVTVTDGAVDRIAARVVADLARGEEIGPALESAVKQAEEEGLIGGSITRDAFKVLGQQLKDEIVNRINVRYAEDRQRRLEAFQQKIDAFRQGVEQEVKVLTGPGGMLRDRETVVAQRYGLGPDATVEDVHTAAVNAAMDYILRANLDRDVTEYALRGATALLDNPYDAEVAQKYPEIRQLYDAYYNAFSRAVAMQQEAELAHTEKLAQEAEQDVQLLRYDTPLLRITQLAEIPGTQRRQEVTVVREPSSEVDWDMYFDQLKAKYAAQPEIFSRVYTEFINAKKRWYSNLFREAGIVLDDQAREWMMQFWMAEKPPGFFERMGPSEGRKLEEVRQTVKRATGVDVLGIEKGVMTPQARPPQLRPDYALVEDKESGEIKYLRRDKALQLIESAPEKYVLVEEAEANANAGKQTTD